MKLNHVDLQVTDADAAREFFERHFELRCVYRRAELALLEDDAGLQLGVSNLRHAPPPAYPPDFHVGFVLERAEDVRAIYDRLATAGVPIKMSPREGGPNPVLRLRGARRHSRRDPSAAGRIPTQGWRCWMTGYLILKWIHVLLAITALGANLTYGLWFARAAREPQHLAFVLSGVRVLDNRIANPAYGLLLITGFALTGMGHIPMSTPWILTALVLYVILIVLAAAGYSPSLRRGIAALAAGGPDSAEYRHAAARGRTIGIVLTIIAVAIVYLMVTKPALWG
jgi:uncharacterized membrane protein